MTGTRRRALRAAISGACALALFAGGASAAQAANLSGALVGSADCTQNTLPRNDDSYTSAVPLAFELNFYGARYGQLWVNNNGNVTFDGPMGTYTPFTLQATHRAIIAPFFADVDTRAGGSDVVRYGYGTTTFEGRPAFCVNWVDVGYYNFRTDKLNSFQLLLVDRSDTGPGDFDIVFNYGSITWETGDASGGTNGLGGTSARVGFSNGDGTPANSYELPGSGIDGTLLDSSSRGLIHNRLGSTQDGRYRYTIRNGRPAPAKYVALGDSYQSGEGAGDYFADTDIDGVNQCHRSPHAYPERLVRDGTVPFELDFRACSGAVIGDLYQSLTSTEGPPWNEGAQFDRLDDQTALTTLGIGGNDLEFADVLSDCIIKHLVTTSCESAYDEKITNNILALQSRTPTDPRNKLQRTYNHLRLLAPRARALVLGYPRFFTVDGGKDASSAIDGAFAALFGDGRCQTIRASDQLWMNYKISQVDRAIESSARSMGAIPVPMYDVPAGHELCGDDPAFLNGVKLPPFNQVVESFHPTAYGHGLIADRIRGVLQQQPEGDIYTVHQGETVTTSFLVPLLTELISFLTDWPGSDVVMTLRSPSGKVYTRASTGDDLFHRNGPTEEIYAIADPEPGEWTIELYGADVAPGGEPTRFRAVATPKPNADPEAAISIVKTGKRTIRASAAGSSDSDGRIVNYLWDFGDGTFAKGDAVTEHRFPGPGTYRVTLVVEDDDRGLGFATADADFDVVAYPFSGFRSPVNNPPTVNVANAGRSIPVKFGLGGNEGLDVLDPGYPKVQRVECDSGAPTDEIEQTVTAGASVLTYDTLTDTYQYVWKTDAAWAGTCRRLVLGLADGTRHTAEFRFR